MSDSGDIVVKGGSVEVTFNVADYSKHGPKTHKHERRKITQIMVFDENEEMIWDSGAKGEVKKYMVKVTTAPA